jgi:hypothetical protein
LGSRIVLCPHGLPHAPDVREQCCDLLLRGGGDLQRVFEANPGGIGRFAAHVARIGDLDSGDGPLVLLHRTNPLGLTILRTRRALEEEVPRLGRASWLVFIDEKDDPFFLDAASRVGGFDRELDALPIWSAPDLHRFLVVSRQNGDLTRMKERLAELQGERPPSDAATGAEPAEGDPAATPCPGDDSSVDDASLL